MTELILLIYGIFFKYDFLSLRQN